MVSEAQMTQDALALGATHAALISTENIAVLDEVRMLCAQNQCGRYGTNWMCPPGCGELDACEKEIHSFAKGLLIQTVGFVEDFADFEGYARIHKEHDQHCKAIFARFKEEYKPGRMLCLSAGGCSICPQCTYPTGEPCRFPDKAVSSLEGYGMVVNQLVTSAKLAYNNGPNSVSYVGLVLFEA